MHWQEPRRIRKSVLLVMRRACVSESSLVSRPPPFQLSLLAHARTHLTAFALPRPPSPCMRYSAPRPRRRTAYTPNMATVCCTLIARPSKSAHGSHRSRPR